VIEIYEAEHPKSKRGSKSDESFDVPEAAKRLGISHALVRKLVKEKRLKSHRIGKLIRFTKKDIDEFISSQKNEMQGKSPRIIKKRSPEPRQRKETETPTTPTREEIRALWQSSKREMPLYGSSKRADVRDGRGPRAKRKQRQSE
jgi:excisionase family DNA binding protein